MNESTETRVTKRPDSDRPLVSVVMPAYNAARFVARSMASLFLQTYTNWELLVVDDGSDDDTAEIVADHRDSRVTILRQRNQGAAAARNTGIAHSKGEFVATFDADDLWHPQKLEKQVQCLLESNARVGVVYAWSLRIDEADQVIAGGCADNATGEVLGPMLYRNFVGNGSAPLFRRSCIEAVGGYSDHRRDAAGQGCEDWDMYLRCAEQFEFRLVPDYLVGYRAVATSMSSDWDPMCRSYARMIRDLGARRPDLPEVLFDWSHSNFSMFMSGQSCRGGAYGSALRLACRAVRHDPMAAFSPRMLILILRCLVGSLTKPQRTERRRRDAASPCTDSAVVGEWTDAGSTRMEPGFMERLSPYGYLRRRRWRRLLANPIPCERPANTGYAQGDALRTPETTANGTHR